MATLFKSLKLISLSWSSLEQTLCKWSLGRRMRASDEVYSVAVVSKAL